jgi:hypothetical protein
MNDYDYSNFDTGNVDSTGLALFSGVGLVIMLLVALVAIVGMWKVFTKAGQPGWAAIIPIYNFYILLKIVGRPVWWLALLLLGIIPIVGPIVVTIVGLVIAIDLAKSFGKSTTFGVVALWLFSIVGYLILGFGDAKYVGPSVKPTASAPRAA